MQVFTLINKTCKFVGTRKSQVSFHLVKPILAAIRCYSKLSVFSSRSSTLGAHFQINNESKVAFPHFFVVRPKTFKILERSGKIKTNTVYQYCQKFNMRKESTGYFILLSLIESSWNNFGISYDFQKCYVVSNFEFLETFSFTRVKHKFYLNVVKYYDHICASQETEKYFTNRLKSVVWILRSQVGVTLHICQILVDLKVHRGVNVNYILYISFKLSINVFSTK